MSEQTAQSEVNFYDFDQSSDEDNDYAPWVDHVRLRHGMDWLDLITNEVDRDTHRVNISLNRRTEADVRDTHESIKISKKDKEILSGRRGFSNKRK